MLNGAQYSIFIIVCLSITNYIVPAALVFCASTPFFLIRCFEFHFICFDSFAVFLLLPQPHQHIMSITNERIKNDKATEHRLHIKWIQFHFIFSTCFICPRDKCERVFFSQNSFTLSILQSLVHEANVRFVCISDSNSYYEAKFPFGWLVSPLFNA